MNHEHACAHVHEHIERVQCLIMMLIDNDNGHVHVHVPCCAPCMKQTIIVFVTGRASRQQKRESDREEHQGPVLAALGAKGLMSFHVHDHEPAFMAMSMFMFMFIFMFSCS